LLLFLLLLLLLLHGRFKQFVRRHVLLVVLRLLKSRRRLVMLVHLPLWLGHGNLLLLPLRRQWQCHRYLLRLLWLPTCGQTMLLVELLLLLGELNLSGRGRKRGFSQLIRRSNRSLGVELLK